MNSITVSLFRNTSDAYVAGLRKGSWESFSASFREPLARSTAKADLPLWAPADFGPDGHRSVEGVEAVHALVLDVDEAPIPDSWELVRALAGLRCVVYSSSSAKELAPRWRVAIDLSRAVTAEEYPRLSAAFTSTLPFAVGSASKDPARQWYGAREGADGSYTYVSMAWGAPLDVDALLALAPVPPVPVPPAPGQRKDAPIGASPQAAGGDVEGAELAYHSRLFAEHLKNAPPSIAGAGGDHALWQVVQHGAYDLALPIADILELVAEHFDPRCSPPWGEELAERVTHKATSAKASSTRPRCVPLPADLAEIFAAKAPPESGVRPVADAAGARSRVVIETGPDLDRVVSEACAALARDIALFKRAGELVRIVRIDASNADEGQHEGTPQIRPLPSATLKVRLTRAARWTKSSQGKTTETTPADDIVAAVSQLGDWPGVRRLIGIVETPALRPDGTILQEPGYDPKTAFFYDPRGARFPKVPDAPTREEAYAALCVLTEPFLDFPFATSAAAMVPVAAVLTLLARPAIEGNVPAILFEATTRGSGKTKLADVVSIIATGRLASKVTFPRTDDELEKLLGGYARRGAVVFTFDNISSDIPFGGAPIDKVLTSGGSVDLRILGKTQVPTFEWRAVVLGTGNNISFRGDTTRRVLVARLESPLENPEDREDFAHPDLLAWVATNRERLAVAGLTVLRAYAVAGRPRVDVKTWGSFESWSALVPRAIVWASGDAQADPQITRPTLDPCGDTEKTLLERLLAVFPAGEWRAKDLLDAGRELDLAAVLEEVVPLTEKNRAGRLGYHLRAWKGRVVGGLRLVGGQDKHSKVATWRAERVT